MAVSPNYSRRRIYWLSQETTTDGLPSSTNTAGSLDLATDGILQCAIPSRGETLVFSTTDLWAVTYIGGTLVYSARQAGNNCGIVSPRGAVVLDSGAYWMGYGKFFCYDGFVRTLPCEVEDYVFGDINNAALSAIWALANPKYNEVTWFYPSSGSSVTDRYVTFNYVENHWVWGTLTRAAGVTRPAGSTLQLPLLIGSTGAVYDHETGAVWGGATPFLDSGPLEFDVGDNVVQVQKIIPDDKTVGDVNLVVFSGFFPDDPETTSGPYTLTKKTDIRLTARQFRIRLQTAAASAWRVGVIRFGAILGGRR